MSYLLIGFVYFNPTWLLHSYRYNVDNLNHFNLFYKNDFDGLRMLYIQPLESDTAGQSLTLED